MRRLCFLLFVVLAPAGWAQTGIVSPGCANPGSVPKAFAFETVTVSTVSIGLTAATYNNPGSGQGNAVMAFLTTATDSMRFRLDGVAPTSTVGHQLVSGSSLVICTSSLASLKMIRSGGSDVPVSVTYFNLAQP